MRTRFPKNPSTFVLAQGELVSLRPGRRACRVFCVAGRLWVTASGHREDWLLGAGQSISINGAGRIVAEALRTSTMRLDISAAANVEQRTGAGNPLSGRPVLRAGSPLHST